MRPITALILSSCLTLSFQSVAPAQNSGTELQLGRVIQRPLSSSEIHTFTVTLEENTFLQLSVEQRGVDVIVHVVSPDGRTIAEHDSPNGTQGVEDVSFVAHKAGIYRITISPLSESPNDSNHDGRYEIKILERRKATDEELKSNNTLEVNEAKGLALLKEVVGSVEQMRPSTVKIRFQLSISKLLESSDKKQATTVITSAVVSLTDILTAIRDGDVDDDSRWATYATANQLRAELVQTLAAFDPSKALEFLRSSRALLSQPGRLHESQEYEDRSLEVLIANEAAMSDPKRSLQIAEEVLKKQYSARLAGTVNALKQTAPELAEKLVAEIVDKLADEKLLQNAEAAQLSTILLGQPFDAEQSQFLSEDTRHKLFQKLLAECLAYSPGNEREDTGQTTLTINLLQTLKNIGPSIDKGSSAAAIQKKAVELGKSMNMKFDLMEELQADLSNGSIEESLEVAKKAPQEIQNQMYQQVADKVAASGDLNRAKQILGENIDDELQRQQLIRNLDQQAAFNSLSKGNTEDALRIIRSMSSLKVRAEMISQMANQIGNGRKKAVALNFLEEARSILGVSTRARNLNEMHALFELGIAFAKHDSARALEILQPLIDQFNELDAAARTLKGFSQMYEYGDGALAYGLGVDGIGTRIANVLGTVAVKDFDGAKALADKVNSPDTRLSAYLEMIRQTRSGKSPN